jgi:hypothetical protein
MALCAPAAAPLRSPRNPRQVNRRDVWRPRGGDFQEESSLSKLKRHVDSEKNKRAETHADYKCTHREQTADSVNAH